MAIFLSFSFVSSFSLSETKIDVETDIETVGESLVELIVENMKSTEVVKVKDSVVPHKEDDPGALDNGGGVEATGMAHPVEDCVVGEVGGDDVVVTDGAGIEEGEESVPEVEDEVEVVKVRSLLKDNHVTREQDRQGMEKDHEEIVRRSLDFNKKMTARLSQLRNGGGEGVELDDEVLTFGDVNLTENELSVLKLGPGLMVVSSLDKESMRIESAVTTTKIRWSKMKDGTGDMTAKESENYEQ